MSAKAKVNLVVPLAGRGQRMANAGFLQPKPMMFAGDRRILEWSMLSVDWSSCRLIFVVRQDHARQHGLAAWLYSRFAGCQVVLAAGDTAGAIESVLLAQDLINNDAPLVVYCPDVYFEPYFTPRPEHFVQAGHLLTFKANSPAYSYVLPGPGRAVKAVQEKQVISDWASVGVYCFQSGAIFCDAALRSQRSWTHRERFIAPLYNWLTPDVTHESVDQVHVMGTPGELRFFEERVFRYFQPRRLVICADHSGFEEKERFKAAFEARGVSQDSSVVWPLIDTGCFSVKDCDYGPFVKDACRFVRQYGCLGVGFCRSGQGINLCAQAQGTHSVLVRDLEDAWLGIEHNAADFFAVSAGKHQLSYPALVETLLTAKFQGGRHQNRLMSV